MSTTEIAIVDDHSLIRKGLNLMIENMNGYKVVAEAGNGIEFIDLVRKQKIRPSIALLDITMPEMNGVETAKWIAQNLPNCSVIALSMLDDEDTIIKMIKAGAKGYLVKNGDAAELESAIKGVLNNGFYFNEYVNGKMIFNLTRENDDQGPVYKLTDKEKEFLKYACSEMAYKEIAAQMNLSIRTVESYRDILCEKLNLRTRVGLVMYAVKNRIVNL